MLKTSENSHSCETDVVPPRLLKFGRLEIDELAREVRLGDAGIHLKPREFALLLALASNAGVAMARERLLDLVWGFDFEGGDRTLDVHIRRLRVKLGETKSGPLLVTLRGFGYEFVYRSNNRTRFVLRNLVERDVASWRVSR